MALYRGPSVRPAVRDRALRRALLERRSSSRRCRPSLQGNVTDHELRSHDDAVVAARRPTRAAPRPSRRATPTGGGGGAAAGPGRPGQAGRRRGSSNRAAGRPAGAASSGEMSARNRELLALIPVAPLVTAGFTRCSSSQSNQIGDLSLTYGAYFLAICVATHLLIRIRLPYADPYLFPLVALLAAFGLVMHVPDRREPGRQAGVAVRRRAGAVRAHDHAAARLLGAGAVPLRDRDGGDPAPGHAAPPRDRRAGQRRLPRHRPRPDLVPACRGGEDLRRHLPRQLPASSIARCWSSARGGSLGITLPPLKHLGPLLVVWGAAMVMLIVIRDLGSSLMFFGAFLALIYVATSRISFVLIGLAHVRARRLGAVRDVGPRRRPRRHLARPVRRRTPGGRGPDHAIAVRAGRRGTVRARGSARRCSSCRGRSSPIARSRSPTAAASCPRRTPTSSTP